MRRSVRTSGTGCCWGRWVGGIENFDEDVMRALLREDVRASHQGGMECALRPSRHRPDSRLEGVVSLDQVLEMVAAGSRLRRALTVAEVAEMAAFVAWDRAVA